MQGHFGSSKNQFFLLFCVYLIIHFEKGAFDPLQYTNRNVYPNGYELKRKKKLDWPVFVRIAKCCFEQNKQIMHLFVIYIGSRIFLYTGKKGFEKNGGG